MGRALENLGESARKYQALASVSTEPIHTRRCSIFFPGRRRGREAGNEQTFRQAQQLKCEYEDLLKLRMVRGAEQSEACFVVVGTNELAGRKGSIVLVPRSHRNRMLKDLARETHRSTAAFG